MQKLKNLYDLDEFEFDNSQQLTSIDELGYKKFRILYGICQVLNEYIIFK